MLRSIVLPSIVLPLAFTLVMAGMRSLAVASPFWDVVKAIGWDLCILGVGVVGGVFANPQIQAAYGGGEAAILAAFGAVAADLLIAIVILKCRDLSARLAGTISISLGAAAVAIPTVLALWK